MQKKMYSTNFTVDNKTFCSSLHYNGDNSYLFVNDKEIINFKAKYSEISNISKHFTSSRKRKNGLNGCVYDFSVDYWAIANDNY